MGVQQITVGSIAFGSAYEPLHIYVETGAQLASSTAAQGKEYSGLTPALPFSPTHLIAARRISDAGTGRIQLASATGGFSRVIHRSPADGPFVASVQFDPAGRLYFKAFDAAGRASFWLLNPNGQPRLLVRLDDLSRPSGRSDFAVDGQRLYFTIDDRQSDIYTVEVEKR